jgi:hypothetical protein
VMVERAVQFAGGGQITAKGLMGRCGQGSSGSGLSQFSKWLLSRRGEEIDAVMAWADAQPDGPDRFGSRILGTVSTGVNVDHEHGSVW